MFDGDERRVMLRTRFLVHSVRILAFYNLIYRFQAESLPLPRRLDERRVSAKIIVFGSASLTMAAKRRQLRVFSGKLYIFTSIALTINYSAR